MVNEFKVEVPITLKGGREGEKVGKQIGEKIAEQIKKVFRGIGITRPTAEGRGIGVETAAVAGMGKSLKGILGKAGLIAMAVTAIVGILSKFSPYLKGVLSIMGRAFSTFFRPFGDFLATLLRPWAILMMKMAVAFLKWTRTPAVEKGKEFLAEAVEKGLMMPIIGIPLAWWRILSKIDFSKLKEFPGWIWEKITNIWSWIYDFGGWIWGKITGIWNYVEDFGSWLWGKVTSIWNYVEDFGSWLWESITSIWSWTYDFGSWLWEQIKGIWSWDFDLGAWLWGQIKKALIFSIPGLPHLQ